MIFMKCAPLFGRFAINAVRVLYLKCDLVVSHFAIAAVSVDVFRVYCS